MSATKQQTQRVQGFYNGYWPAHVPDYERTREHVFTVVPPGDYQLALDAGCGSGVCSLALAERAEKVIGFDLSPDSLSVGIGLADGLGKHNITFQQGTLLELPFDDATFDLVWSWGVIHHTVDPVGALDELVRVLKPGGLLVLAVYLKTNLTWFHELVRRICLNIPSGLMPLYKTIFIEGVTAFVRVAELFGARTRTRDDVHRIQSLIEDWYFVPEKHFFTIAEMHKLFAERGLTYEVVFPMTARFHSTSNFVVRGAKAQP